MCHRFNTYLTNVAITEALLVVSTFNVSGSARWHSEARRSWETLKEFEYRTRFNAERHAQRVVL